MAHERHKLDDAAAAALWQIAHAPVEYMGALYGDDLSRSELVTSGRDARVRGKLQIPGGASAIRALFHNHPPDKRSSVKERRAQFTLDDRVTAQGLGVPSYIAAGDRVMRYDPADGTTAEVLAQFPIEVLLQHLAQSNPLVAAVLAQRGPNPFATAAK